MLQSRIQPLLRTWSTPKPMMMRAAAGQVCFIGTEGTMKENATVLKRELRQVRNQIATLEKATSTEPDYGLGEGDPAITRRQVDRALLERLRERAETLELAVSGIGKGTYGICELCGDLIHPDRLAVLPDTRLCVHCARVGQHPRFKEGEGL